MTIINLLLIWCYSCKAIGNCQQAHSKRKCKEDFMRKLIATGVAVSLLLSGAFVTAQASNAPTLINTATLANQPLKNISNLALPFSVANDFGVQLGGLGSDMFRVLGAPFGEYWVVTDRGPNVDTVLPTGGGATGFLVPDFSPLILKVKVEGSNISILQTIAIKDRNGRGITGLPNIQGYDAIPSDIKGTTGVSLYNLAGLDVEGLVRTRNGSFWVVDEYAPSLALISSKGVLTERWVPAGWSANPTNYKINKTIPGIYLKRKPNRGFEALAMSPDESTLFIGLQSPLLNPSTAVGNASRMTRILRFDVNSKQFTGEFIYPFELPATVDKTTTKTTELKLSALVALDNDTLLVQERTDNSFLLTTIELKESGNILGSKWDLLETTPSLENWAVAVPEGIAPLIASLDKKIVFDSSMIPSMPTKIEGVAVLDSQHIALINDNDFNFSYSATTGQATSGSNLTKILTVKLAQPLPTYPDVAIARLGRLCYSVGQIAGDLKCTENKGSIRWRR